PKVFYSLTQSSEYIKTKGFGVDVRLLIAQLAEHFGLKSTQIIDLANLLQSKFDNLEGVTQSFTDNINSLVAQMEADKDAVIANATVDSEIILARGGKATLGDRLDDNDAQLAQTNHKVLDSRSNLTPNISKGLMVSFVDDDISNHVWSRLKPLFESKGVPVTLGAISDRFKEGTHLTVEQALTLQNELGWEIASHGKTPRVLTQLSEVDIENELKESYDVLTDYGFDVNHYILSNGAHDERVRRLVRKYYKSASATTFDHGINNVPIRQYNLYRRDLYAYSNFTLDQHKAHV